MSRHVWDEWYMGHMSLIITGSSAAVVPCRTLLQFPLGLEVFLCCNAALMMQLPLESNAAALQD